jgi:hypothetical protein
MATEFITPTPGDTIQIKDDTPLLEKLMDICPDVISEFSGQYYINKSAFKACIDELIGETTSVETYKHVSRYLKTESDIDYQLLLESEPVMKFIADIEQTHIKIAKRRFDLNIKAKESQPHNYVHILSDEYMDNYKIPSDIDMSGDNARDTHGGMIVISPNKIDKIGCILPNQNIRITLLPKFVHLVSWATTEDSSTLHIEVPDIHEICFPSPDDRPKWHATSIPYEEVFKPYTWAKIFRSMIHCRLDDVPKEAKEQFVEMIDEMLNDAEPLTDTSSKDLDEIISDMDEWALTATNMDIHWVDTQVELADDETYRSIYVDYNHPSGKPKATITSHIIKQFCKNQWYGSRHFATVTNAISKRFTNGAEPRVKIIDYEIIESVHKACKDAKGHDPVTGNKLVTDTDENKIPEYTEQSQIIKQGNTDDIMDMEELDEIDDSEEFKNTEENKTEE